MVSVAAANRANVIRGAILPTYFLTTEAPETIGVLSVRFMQQVSELLTGFTTWKLIGI